MTEISAFEILRSIQRYSGILLLLLLFLLLRSILYRRHCRGNLELKINLIARNRKSERKNTDKHLF